MNCKECKDLLIEFSEGLLHAHVKESIERHLEGCAECMKEAEDIFALQDRLLKNSRESSSINLENRVMERIAREQKARLKAFSSAGFIYQIRRFFMKNALLKIAATAAVVLAVFIGLNFSRSDVSFARVAEPILHARTLEYDVVVPRMGGVWFHDIVAEGKIRRNYHIFSQDAIIDVDNSSVLNLDTVHKTAVFAEAETEVVKMSIDINRDVLKLVRGAVGEALNDIPSAVEELGQKKMDGHIVFGYRLPSGTDGEEVVIWADHNTGLPIEININLGMSYPDSLTTTESLPSTPEGATRPKLVATVKFLKNYTLKNIRFDVTVDESLMEMPSDYKLIDREQFTRLMTENGFVKMLHVWAEKLSGGFFPDNLPPATIRNQFIRNTVESSNYPPGKREKLIAGEVFRMLGLAHVPKDFMIDLSPEEMGAFSETVTQGFVFINNLGFWGSEWSYSGSGVRLGEGDREIFRYKLPDSSSWHVIYGDLHVEDTLTNIRFDTPVDESLIERPSEHKLIDMKQFTVMMENGFIKMLHLWVEKLSDGFFPENLPPADFRRQFMSGFYNTMKATPEERDKIIPDEILRTVGLDNEAKQFLVNLNPEEWEELLITASEGIGFINNLENRGIEWQYCGSGVRLGEKHREIFRYKMPGSSWRVIYGDLHAEDALR